MAAWKREFKPPWCEAGPPHHLDDKVDSDQQVVSKELSLSLTSFKTCDPHQVLIRACRETERGGDMRERNAMDLLRQRERTLRHYREDGTYKTVKARFWP